MNAKKQLRRRNIEDEPRYVIGMDAHSRKLAISIWDWSDRFNACIHREIKCMDIEAMVKTYERCVDPDSITIIESSTNSATLKKMLNEAGYRAEIVRADIIANVGVERISFLRLLYRLFCDTIGAVAQKS